jgi:polyisoprenoid-binding protein YceI
VRTAGALTLAIALVATGGPAGADTRTWSPAPEASLVAFDARFTLGDFSGEAHSVQGELTLDAVDLRKPVAGTLRVPVAALRTGVAGRDADLRRLLEADRHPELSYRVEGVEASFPQIADKTDVLLTIKGVLTVRGQARPVSFLGRVRARDGRLWVRGESQVKMSDFGVTPPRRLLLFRVRDEILLRFDLLLTAPP